MPRRQKLLIIDDEADIRELLKEMLEADFDVLLASDGKAGLRVAREEKPDLIILDVLMPETDGFYICEYMRGLASTREIPIIMLTAVQETSNRIKAFNSGADDFISKPFHPEELLARIRAKLRKGKAAEFQSAAKLIRCGNLTLDPQNMETRVGSKNVQLTRLEFDLVKFLVLNKGVLKGRREIVDQLWYGERVPDRILDPHLVAIRKKLAGFDHEISTVYGAGYILKRIPDSDVRPSEAHA